MYALYLNTNIVDLYANTAVYAHVDYIGAKGGPSIRFMRLIAADVAWPTIAI